MRVQDHEAFGMWADREDMKDVDAYVRRLRQMRPHISRLMDKLSLNDKGGKR